MYKLNSFKFPFFFKFSWKQKNRNIKKLKENYYFYKKKINQK